MLSTQPQPDNETPEEDKILPTRGKYFLLQNLQNLQLNLWASDYNNA